MLRFPAVLAFTALMLAPARPALAEDWSAMLLDRTVSLTIPDGFAVEPAFTDQGTDAAILEFLPPGETLKAWSQMLTLTAHGGAAAGLDPFQATQGMALRLAQGYGSACPDGLATMDLGAPAVSGADAVFAAWMGCDQVGPGGLSEAMVVLVITAGGSLYTAQWAERAPATAGPPVFDFDHWLPRLDALMTLRL